MVNTAAISTLPASTTELYAQLLFVALQRLGLDAQGYFESPERAAAASDAFSTLWLIVELAAAGGDPAQLDQPRFERTRELDSLTALRPLAQELDAGARQQLAALNGSGWLEVQPHHWSRFMPPRGTDVMSTLALAWLAEAAVLGDELVGWLANPQVLRRVVELLAVLIELALQGAPPQDVEHLPLSRSAVSEEERRAVIDVWRAQQAVLAPSGVVPKASENEPEPAVRPAGARPGREVGRPAGRRQRLQLVFAGISLCLALVVWLWLVP